MKVDSLAGAFGARVSGVDVAAGLSAGTVRRLVDLLYEHRVLILSGQSMALQDYAAFGEHWGNPLLFHNPERRAENFPSIIPVSNAPTRGKESKDGAAHWHSDSSYEAVPASVTMLYCVEAPEEGGETLFADTIAAFESLDADKKARIADIVVQHRMGSAPRLAEEVPVDPGVDLSRFPVVNHPLAMTHPVIGRPALFVSGTAWRIEGWFDEAARQLILDLRAHIAQPRFRQSWKARPGDIVIWDNFATVHSATPLPQSDREGERRLLYRISTKGLPACLDRQNP